MLTTLRPRHATARLSVLTVVGVAAAVGYLLGLAWAMTHTSFDIWGAMVVGPILVGISIPILMWIARHDADPLMGRILAWAFAAKMAGTLVRYAVVFELYGGQADATGYHGAGRRLANAFWNGTWDEVLRSEVPELAGTEFIRLFTGLTYIVTGPTKLGGFLVFSWLGFWGLVLFTRAFRVAFPSGDHRRYALLTFFLPSLLFWPSSIGKESWMLFALGVVAYGAARLLTHRTDGYLIVALGLAGTAAVRPHVTLLAFFALLAGALLRRRPLQDARTGLFGRLAGLVVLAAIGAAVITQTADFFNVDGLDQAAIEQVLDRTEDQSSRDTSAFEAPRMTSPGEYPRALMSVLFRPFPWEAGSAQSLASAAEGFAVLVVAVCSLRRLARLPATIVRVPYVAMAAVYTAVFVAAFSAVGNFGILARQRTQVMPFVLVLLSLPAVNRAVAAPVQRARERRTTSRPSGSSPGRSEQFAAERTVAQAATRVQHQSSVLGDVVER